MVARALKASAISPSMPSRPEGRRKEKSPCPSARNALRRALKSSTFREACCRVRTTISTSYGFRRALALATVSRVPCLAPAASRAASNVVGTRCPGVTSPERRPACGSTSRPMNPCSRARAADAPHRNASHRELGNLRFGRYGNPLRSPLARACIAIFR